MDLATQITVLLQTLFGDRAIDIIAVLAMIGYAWALLRQCISDKTMAKLPTWLINVLEFIAANKWKSKNMHDPATQKKGQ
ncbi:hypothetical protein [Photobacterium leiognathi]|uniref:hypothetical protein n=1 Tax=Photobacterium leiognathi TaxID=553611 RepID=UPI000D16F28E|nr:hypothetical protein [Photobacterium leiognathi]PSW53033.1 hypothetical protein C0W50_19690 [Photobacterium leiognathi subsp. mandapamensis]